MKYLIASDIHGSAFWCKKLLERFAAEKADRMILLGDILYHGPRNDLPEGYAPKEVIGLLNDMRDRLFCVRGNCEAEVDQMVLTFPVLADYALMEVCQRTLFITHGHHYHANALPPLQKGDMLIHGHTHVPLNTEAEGIRVMNPGSVSIPKANSAHGYMTLEDGCFLWKDMDGQVYDTFRVK